MVWSFQASYFRLSNDGRQKRACHWSFATAQNLHAVRSLEILAMIDSHEVLPQMAGQSLKGWWGKYDGIIGLFAYRIVLFTSVITSYLLISRLRLICTFQLYDWSQQKSRPSGYLKQA